jgi:HAMP domain-containing protein
VPQVRQLTSFAQAEVSAQQLARCNVAGRIRELEAARRHVAGGSAAHSVAQSMHAQSLNFE